MVRAPTASQHIFSGIVCGVIVGGMTYGLWAILGQPSGTTRVWILGGAFVAGFLLSVGSLNASHSRSVRRFAASKRSPDDPRRVD